MPMPESTVLLDDERTLLQYRDEFNNACAPNIATFVYVKDLVTGRGYLARLTEVDLSRLGRTTH